MRGQGWAGPPSSPREKEGGALPGPRGSRSYENRGQRVPVRASVSPSCISQEGNGSGSHDGAGGSSQSWGCRWQGAAQPMATPDMPSPACPGMGVPQTPKLRSEAVPWPLPHPRFRACC